MAQRSPSLWVSSCSESNRNENIECSSEAQDSMDYTSLTSDLQVTSDDGDQHELAPPMVKKVAKSKSIDYRYSTKHPWLVSDGSGRGAFCKVCKQLYCDSHSLPKGSDGTFISKLFTKWSKATGSSAKNNKLLKHQISNSHRQAVPPAEMCNDVERRGSVFTQLQCSSNAEKSENLLMLSKYLKVAYWLMQTYLCSVSI